MNATCEQVGADGKLSQRKKVKLSVRGDGADLRCTWDGYGLVIGANNEANVRLWSIVTDESYVLPLSGHCRRRRLVPPPRS